MLTIREDRPNHYALLPVRKAPLHPFVPLTAQFFVLFQLLLSEDIGETLPGFFVQGIHLRYDLFINRLHDLPALFLLLLQNVGNRLPLIFRQLQFTDKPVLVFSFMLSVCRMVSQQDGQPGPWKSVTAY